MPTATANDAAGYTFKYFLDGPPINNRRFHDNRFNADKYQPVCQSLKILGKYLNGLRI